MLQQNIFKSESSIIVFKGEEKDNLKRKMENVGVNPCKIHYREAIEEPEEGGHHAAKFHEMYVGYVMMDFDITKVLNLMSMIGKQ